MRINVVLPAPLGPRKPNTSPALSSSETSLTAMKSPKRQVTPRACTVVTSFIAFAESGRVIRAQHSSHPATGQRACRTPTCDLHCARALARGTLASGAPTVRRRHGREEVLELRCDRSRAGHRRGWRRICSRGLHELETNLAGQTRKTANGRIGRELLFQTRGLRRIDFETRCRPPAPSAPWGEPSASVRPSCRKTRRSQRSASSMYEVATTIAAPWRRKSSSSVHNSRRDSGSTPRLGSSSSSTRGS